MNSIITLNDVSFELPNGRELFRHLNFSLDSRLTALVGPNGIGKSTLARILSAELEPTQGMIRRSQPIVFFPQREQPPPVRVEEFLALDYTWSPLGEGLLQGIQRQVLCSTLSGGQWMRVRLARVLNDQFLILDEPTNDLDREARGILMQFLLGHQGGVLLISHDREYLELCEEVLELSSQGLSKFGGNWSSYCEHKEKERTSLHRGLELAKRDRDFALSDRLEQQNRQEKRNRRGAEAAARGGLPKILLGEEKERPKPPQEK